MNLYEACDKLGIWKIAKARAEVWATALHTDDSLDEIRNIAKNAFKILAMKYHPDKGGNDDEFLNIKKACDTIQNASINTFIDAINEYRQNSIEHYNPGSQQCHSCTKWSSVIELCTTTACSGYESHNYRHFNDHSRYNSKPSKSV